MVIQMNKKEFINTLQKELNYDEDKCIIINDILENTFLLGKKNKDIMISEFISKLDISSDEAEKIYEIAMSILSKELKKSILHPFRSKD